MFGFNKPKPEPTIGPDTPPDVARTLVGSWQRHKELDFAAGVEILIAQADRKGLEKRRIARVIAAIGKVVEKVGA